MATLVLLYVRMVNGLEVVIIPAKIVTLHARLVCPQGLRLLVQLVIPGSIYRGQLVKTVALFAALA